MNVSRLVVYRYGKGTLPVVDLCHGPTTLDNLHFLFTQRQAPESWGQLAPVENLTLARRNAGCRGWLVTAQGPMLLRFLAVFGERVWQRFGWSRWVRARSVINGFCRERRFMLASHPPPTSALQTGPAWGNFVQHVPGTERFPRNWIRGVRPVVEARRTLDALIVISRFRFGTLVGILFAAQWRIYDFAEKGFDGGGRRRGSGSYQSAEEKWMANGPTGMRGCRDISEQWTVIIYFLPLACDDGGVFMGEDTVALRE